MPVTQRAGAASAFLRAVAGRLPRGRVLDVAMGEGRNALFLARRRHAVVGIDRSLDAVRNARRAAAAAGLLLEAICADLEAYALPSSAFDVVVNIRYLQRSLIPGLCQALRPGGMMVFETFLVDQLALGHPRNPAFTLQHNELLRLSTGLRVLHYEEGCVAEGGGPVHLARMLAQRA